MLHVDWFLSQERISVAGLFLPIAVIHPVKPAPPEFGCKGMGKRTFTDLTGIFRSFLDFPAGLRQDEREGLADVPCPLKQPPHESGFPLRLF
jgi:hypothetical protein